METRDKRALLRLLGQRIRSLRYQRGWKQVDLSVELDGKLSRSAISYIENGRKCPSFEILLELAEAFEVDPAALLLNPDRSGRHATASMVLGCASSEDCSVGEVCEVCRAGRRAPEEQEPRRCASACERAGEPS